MATSWNRRRLNLWKSRTQQSKRRSTRRRLGELLEPRILLAADADLAITGSAPATATMGETITVSWTVQNEGLGLADAAWTDSIYLSSDDTFDATDQRLERRRVLYDAPLPAGAEYTAQRNLSIPSTTVGEQYLLFITDTTEIQEETNEQNNTVAVAIDIAAPDVDLTVTSISAPATAVAGAPFTVSWTVQNGGSESTNARPWQDWVYLSDDMVLDEADLRIGTGFTDPFLPVGPGESYSPTLELTRLNANQDGDQFLLVVADGSGFQGETDDSNNVTAVPINIAAPNLTFSQADAPSTAEPGEQITVTYQVTNNGDVPASADWRDRLYFSTDDQLGGDRYLLQFSTSGVSPLGAGESYQVVQNFTLPNDLAGDGFLLFAIDTDSVQPETDETDNVLALPISIPPADFEVVDFTAPSTAVAGSTIDLTWTVANNGSGPAVSQWDDRIYVSTDDILDDEDESLRSFGIRNVAPLAPGSDYVQTQQVDLDDVQAGDYFLIVQTDSRRRLPESDEENNTRSLPITISAPNLVPTDLDIPDVVVAGQQITADWVVLNDSQLDANGNWQESLYLSSDTVFDDTDLYLSGRSVNALGAGESHSQSLDFNLRGAAGEQFILLVVDPSERQGETNESDNVIAKPITIVAANLTSTDFAAPGASPSGATIDVTWTVTNDSEYSADGQWYDNIYLSSDDTFDPTDRRLAQIYQGSRSPLAAGASYVETTEVALSRAPAGSQFLLLVTDALQGQPESDESDNVRAVSIDISLPNLKVTDVSAPSTAVSGDTITVSWTTANDSPVVAAADWRDWIFLSRDELFDSGDRSLSSLTAGSFTPLAAGESYSTSRTDVKLTRIVAGEYFVLVTANRNSEQGETNDYDNVLATPITIVLPDVEAKEFNAPSSAVLGQTLNVTWTVENISDVVTGEARWADEIYLSDDAVLNTGIDRRLVSRDNRSELPLHPGESYTASQSLFLPSVETGTKFLILTVDKSNKQYESDETNNQIVIPIELNAPDLVVFDSISPDTVIVGEQMDLSWTVTNQGDFSALGGWNDKVYLSDNDLFDSADIPLLGKGRPTTLEVGESYTLSGDVTLSNVDQGSQFLLFVTDVFDQQGETDNTNNVRAVPITVTAPDLVVTNAETSAIVNLGDAIDVTWTVDNVGDVSAVANWSDGIYLSRDNKLDSSDADLRFVSSSAEIPLAAGASYTKTQSVLVAENNTPSGNMFLLVVADAQFRQGETNEQNNVFAIPIEVRSPDLIVTSITGPEIVKPGQEAEISWTVQNVGEGIATRDWTDFIAISEDENLDCPFDCGEFDIALPSSEDFVPLGPGESYTQTQTFTIPQGTGFGELLEPGEYFLGVKADENYGSEQPESNENNNELLIPITVIAPDVDLVVSDLIVQASADLGETIEITATITNLGTETATGRFNNGWTDRISMSSDPVIGFNNSIPLLFRSNRNEAPLGPGESYTFTEQVDLTSYTTGGSRYIVVTADTGSQVETDETNNAASQPIEIFAPNLIITSYTAPAVAALSQFVRVSWTVQNDSDSAAYAYWRDTVYLSDDALFDSGDRFLDQYDASGQRPLAPAATYTANVSFTFRNVTAGSKYLLFVTDSNNSQGETNEDDNVFAVPIEIASADLVLTDVSGPSEVAVGQTVSISRTVENQGVGPAPASWSDAVYLSLDTTIDASDPRVGIGSASAFRPLGVGTGYTAPIDVTIPNVAPGNYFFIVRADAFGAQSETSESNNTVNIAVTIVAPDLSLSDATAPTTAVSNDTISVSYTVTNVSTSVAGADWQDRIYLSTDGTLGGLIQPPLLTEPVAAQTPLSGGGSYTVSRDVTLPGVNPGDYFLVFQTNSNNGQGETDSSNNVRSELISIVAPNLTLAEASGPANGLVNEVINVSYRVLNDSTLTAAGDWTDQIWLSDDETFDASNDRFLQSLSAGDQSPLVGGADYTIDTTVILPRDSSGEKFLLFRANADNRQGETSYDDNVRSVAISIAEPPNLVVTEIQAPDVAAVHELVTVSYTVTNTGTTPAVGNWQDNLRLYSEADLGSSGSFLGSANIDDQTPLAPGASYTFETTVRMPATPGDRFLLVRANDVETQGETSYDDNHLFRPIMIVAPDLVIDQFSGPEEGGLGEPISISYVVTNQSSIPALNQWQDRVYLSLDQILDPGDTPIADGRIQAPTTLAGGESYLVSQQITIPRVPTGNRFLILTTDENNRQAESDETNNVSTAISILLQASDLVVTDIVVPAEAISGQAFNVTWTVTNVGEAAVSNWTDRILVSSDQGIGGDLTLGDFPFSGVLMPGQSVTRTQGATTPIEFNGSRYVVVTADPGDTKPETNELNNSAISTEPVLIQQAPIPNLQASNVTSSATERPVGEPFEVQWVVTNTGTGATTTPYWRDYVYLSVDDSFDGTDVRIGNVLNPNFLNAGEAYTGTATVSARDVSEGDYYLIVRADGRDNLEEYSGEGDNITVGPLIRITVPPPPDLVVNNVVAPELAFSGQPMALSWVVQNQGDSRARSRWDDAVYMSVDDVLDATDTLLATVPHQTLYQIFRTRSYSGDYENCFGQPEPDPVTDLYRQSPDGNSISNSLFVLRSNNRSQTVCSTTDVSGNVFESVFYETDYSFETIESFLDVDQTYARTVNVRLPIGVSGEYFFFVLTDVNRTVNEFAFDDNNENFDAIATTVNLTPPPDLEVIEIEPPASAEAGRAFSFSYSAINAGATRIPNASWRDAFYLSDDDQFDSDSDILLGQRFISFPATAANGFTAGLETDGTYSRDVTLTMPNGLSGSYYLIAVADQNDDVFEVDDANNSLVSATAIEVQLRAPDLVVTAVTADSSVRAGQSITLGWTVTNQGIGDTIASSWIDLIYASTDDQVGNDRFLRAVQRYGRLDPGQSYDVVQSVQIPLDLSGDISVYVRTDLQNQVVEFTGESNNASEFVAVNVVRETADLQVTATGLSAEDGRVRLSWQVENVGVNRPNSGYWRDTVYLSPNEIFGDQDDIRLSSIYVSRSMEPGQTYAFDRLFEVPFDLNDTYNFFVVTDEQNRVDEDGNENNNSAFLGTLDTATLRRFPDLVVYDVDAPAEAISGQFFDLSWTVRNYGDPIEPDQFPPEYETSSWTDSVYLSRDQVFDPATDFYLGALFVNRSELVEMTEGADTFQQYVRSGTFRVPDGLTGPLYVIVNADRSNQVIEIAAEANNSGLDSGAMFASLAEVADLAIGVVNVPADTGLGSSIELTYTLENLGVNRVVGRWSDRLYLSTDDQFSLDDISLGFAARAFSVIEPGASASYDFLRLLPAALPGDYYVVLRTDAFNVIPESDELNNIGASLDTFSISVPTITLVDGTGSTEIETFIPSRITRTFYYRFDVEDGQTIAVNGIGVELAEETYIDHLGRVRTDVRRGTVTAAYIAYQRVPTPVDYDFAENRLYTARGNDFGGDRLVIPRTEPGSYYLRIDIADTDRGSSFLEPSRERVNIELNVLPFSIVDVSPARVGNVGEATVEVTASDLSFCSVAELLRDGEVVRSTEQIRLSDRTNGWITFDLSGLDPGTYELRLTNRDGSAATHTMEVVDGVGARVDGSIRGPAAVRPGVEYVFYANYGNNGDTDGIAPLLLITNLDASPFSLTRRGLNSVDPSAGNAVQALGISPDGPSGVMRPGQRNSVPLFFKPIGVGSVGQFQLHTITADDTRPIDFDLIESQIRPDGLTDAEWSSLRDGLIDRIGLTWGSYVRTLAAVATDLSDIGARTNNIDVIFAELVRQISDPNSVSASGYVVAGDACSPIPNASLRATTADGPTLVALSDAGGRYQFPGAAPGEYTISVDALGYARETRAGILLGDDSLKLTFELQSESTVSGTITLADGLANTGKILIGATLDRLANEPEGLFTTNTIGGTFELDRLPAGTFQISISLADYVDQSLEVQLGSGESMDLGTITLLPDSIISGTVSSFIGDFAADDAVIAAFSGGTLVSGSEVDAAGQFELSGIGPGDYIVKAINLVGGFSSIAEVTVGTDDLVSGVNIVLQTGSTISGTVTDSLSADPLGIVPVHVVGPGGEIFSDFTNASGMYEIDGLGLGEYYVTLPVSTGDSSTVVTVDSIAGATFAADLTFTSSTQLTGLLTLDDGEPVTGANISLRQDGLHIISTRTDENGRYSFLLVGGGEFDIVTTIDGASFPIASDVTVSEGNIVTLDLVAGTGTLTVNVSNGTNNSQDDVIFLYRVAGDEQLLSGSAFVGSSGSVQFDNLVSGEYSVRAFGAGDRGARVTTTITSGQTSQVDVTLEQQFPVTVTVLDPSDLPIANAFVQIYDGATLAAAGYTGTNGELIRGGIPSGNYDLVVFADGFAPFVLTGVTIESANTQSVVLESTSGRVVGTLLDPDGNVIPIATVQVFDADGRMIGAQAVTEGTFDISTGQASGLRLVVTATGYAAAVVNAVDVAVDSTTSIGNLELVPVAITQGTGTQAVPEIAELGASIVAAPSVAQNSDFLRALQLANPAIPDSAISLLVQNPQLVSSQASGSFVSTLLGDILGYTFGEGDFERQENTEIQASAIVPLPSECISCASLRNQAVIAQQAQSIRAEIGEIIDGDLFYQRGIVVGIFTLELTALIGGVAGTLAAGLALGSALAGSAAVGTAAVTPLAITQTVLSVIASLQNVYLKTTSLADAPDTSTAVQTTNDVGGIIENLLGVIQNGLNWINPNSGPSATPGVGQFAGVASILGGIYSFYSAIQFTNTINSLNLLEELEFSMAGAKVNYTNSKFIALDKLSDYLACINIPEDCDPNDGSGNNGNNNGINAGIDPNTPTPPTPPAPPNQYQPALIQSIDPNDIIGPEGFGEEGWIGAEIVLPYMIRFENVPEATGAAQRVTIEQQLDDDLDYRTFRVDDFGWDDLRIELDGDLPFYQGRIALPDDGAGNGPLAVDVTVTVDTVSGILRWILQTVDPNTGEAPTDALAGFLPPNDPRGTGEGFVTYTIRPRRGSQTGTRIDAEATIVFDTNEPIDTPPIFNTLDAVSATSQVDLLPEIGEEPQFLVRWSGVDDENGSALADYDVLVSVDNGPWETWLQNTTLTEAIYDGQLGRRYAFASTARDNAGNDEPLLAEPDATILVGTVGAPTVVAVTIQNGLSQRSYVDTLQFDFSEQMNLAELIADGRIVDAVRITNLGINIENDADQPVPLAVAQFSYQFDEAAGISRLVWSLDQFAGSGSSLDDGMYQIVFDAGLVSDAEGVPLDGDGDELGGDDYLIQFHRLQGDADGSALVDSQDMDLVNSALGTRPSLPGWNPNTDLDRDDRISVRDRVIVARADGNGIIDSLSAGSAFDANGDGKVSALDALVIVNQLGRQRASGEASPVSDVGPVDRFDVNRDGRVSALDALQVINALADRTRLVHAASVGEGEAESSDLPISQAIDAVVAGAREQSDDTDDDLLRLLADDQARIEIGNMI